MVEVAVLGSPSLIQVRTVSVDVKQHRTKVLCELPNESKYQLAFDSVGQPLN